MNNFNVESEYKRLLDETKYVSHGLWKKDNFKDWGKSCLKVIEQLSGITSTYYITFLRVHHEAMLLGTDDERFGTHMSLCISILKSVYEESGLKREKQA